MQQKEKYTDYSYEGIHLMPRPQCTFIACHHFLASKMLNKQNMRTNTSHCVCVLCTLQIIQTLHKSSQKCCSWHFSGNNPSYKTPENNNEQEAQLKENWFIELWADLCFISITAILIKLTSDALDFTYE